MPLIPPAANITYNIIASYPHDTSSFTQGLIWKDGMFYEGTGLEGHSKLALVDKATGVARQTVKLGNDIFGEGITMLDNKIYQLTWKNNKVYVYDAKTFAKLNEFAWPHDGWGLTDNGKELIVSTGSSTLYYVDPATFKVIREVQVMDNNGPMGNLNELEYVKGFIYANIYLTDYIVKIDPQTGHIVGKMNLGGLLQKSGKVIIDDGHGLVLNGIAYDSAKDVLYITGKKWPLLFEIKPEQ